MIGHAPTTKTSGSKDNGREHQDEYTETKKQIVDIFFLSTCQVRHLSISDRNLD